MSEITVLLTQIETGDPVAADRLLPLVYDELRKLAAHKLAQERPGQTLQATALVHEAYLRLVDVEKVQNWNSRGHFFGAAAEAMRRILVNRARDKHRLKRGGNLHRVDIEKIELALDAPDEQLLALDESLERLAEESGECANLVKLRFYAGMTISDAASAMGISLSTAKRHWAFARAWLFEDLQCDSSIDNPGRKANLDEPDRAETGH